MKFLFTTLLLLSTILVYSQSNLTVFNNGGQKFYLILNGIKQNSLSQTNVVVSGIKNGGYSLKVIFEDGKTKDIEKNFFIDQAYDITTRIVFKKGVGKIQLVSQVATIGVSSSSDAVTFRPDDNVVFSDVPVVTQNATPGSNTVVVTETTTSQTSSQTNNSQNQGENGSVNIQVGTNTQIPNSGGNINVNGNVPNGNTQNNTNGGVTIQVTDPVTGQNINMNMGVQINDATNMQNGQNTNVNTNTSGQGGNVNVNMGVNSGQVQPNMNSTINMNGTGTQSQSSYSSTTVTTTTTTSGTNSTNTSTTTVNGNSNTNANATTTGGSSNGRMVCSKTLSNVETLKTELNGYSFEDDRVGALKISLKNKCLNATDAMKLMDLFTFDANQLEVAKFLSDHLLDYDNASSLATKFSFESSKMEYMEYVGRD